MGTKKQITFDLDTNALQIYYPSDSWRNAYSDIKRFMEKNDFEWIQGSAYISKKPLTAVDTSLLIKRMVDKYDWLNVCMRDCKETNIGRQFDKNGYFDSAFLQSKTFRR